MVIGLFIGRFQPFHKGHLWAIKGMDIDKKVIAIGSADQLNTYNNPLSSKERHEIISKTLDDENIKNYEIVEIPDIHSNERWVNHVKSFVPEFDLVYSGSELTTRLFSEAGYKIVELKRIKEISASKIKEKILGNESWEEFVPKKTFELLKEYNFKKRLLETK